MRRAVMVACALALTACSTADASPSQGAVAAQQDRAASTTRNAAAPSKSAAAGRQPAPSNPAAGGATTSPSSPDSGAALPNSAEISVRLGAACVTPGGRQTLTITTRGQASVSFNTRYADGHLGNTYGGVGIGTTTADGAFHTAWTVAAAAPLGSAAVMAGMSRDSHWWTAPAAGFTVAARC